MSLGAVVFIGVLILRYTLRYRNTPPIVLPPSSFAASDQQFAASDQQNQKIIDRDAQIARQAAQITRLCIHDENYTEANHSSRMGG